MRWLAAALVTVAGCSLFGGFDGIYLPNAGGAGPHGQGGTGGSDAQGGATDGGAGGQGGASEGGTGGSGTLTSNGQACNDHAECISQACTFNVCTPWVVTFDATHEATVETTALATDGSIYVAGHFRGTLKTATRAALSGDETVTSWFVVKLAADGTEQWAMSMPTTESNSYALDMVVDPVGELIIVGMCAGNTFSDADGANTAGVSYAGGSSDLCIAKYTAAGKKVWAAAYGSTGGDNARAVAVAADSSIYLSGSYSGAVSGLSDLLNMGSGSGLGYVLKLNSAGEAQWAVDIGLGGDSHAEVAGLAERAGSVYFGGTFSGEGMGLPTTSGSEMVSGRIVDGTGTVSEAYSVHSASTVAGTHLALGDGTRVYTVGDTYGPYFLDEDTTTNGAEGDVGILVASDNGNISWTVPFEGPLSEHFSRVVTRGVDVWVLGSFDSNTVTFGGAGMLTNNHPGTSALAVARFNQDGALQEWQLYGANGHSTPGDLQVHPDTGNVILSGTIDGVGADFGGVGVGMVNTDGFVASLGDTL